MAMTVAGQQRHGRRGAGTQDRHALAHAPLHVHQCRVGYHDGIVDEHAHCNDDRRERHTLQGDTLHVHHHQRGKMEKTSPLPIRMPFFTPMKKSSTATTVTTEIIRFRINPRLATADSYPWS